MQPAVRRLAPVLIAVLAVLAACTSPSTSPGRSASTTGTTTRAITATEVTPSTPSPVTTLAAAVDVDDPVAAAVGFLELTERVTSMTPDEAADAQASISADGAREVLASKTRDEVERTVAGYDLGTIHLQITPLAARRTDWATATTVAIWYLGVVIVDHGTASSFFRTATYTLVWEHDTWRMTSLESTPGPTPMPTKDAYLDSALQLTGALGGFTRLPDPGSGR
jgi:hypothetical protein